MYKLKNGVELPKEFKIKVNPKQSEALQLHLFSIGKTWFNVGKKVQYYGDHYIYCHSYHLIGQGDDKEKFKSMFTDYPRIKFKDYFEKVTNQFPENWQDKAIHYKQRCKDLRLERYEMSKELETYKSVIRKIESNLKNMFIPF